MLGLLSVFGGRGAAVRWRLVLLLASASITVACSTDRPDTLGADTAADVAEADVAGPVPDDVGPEDVPAAVEVSVGDAEPDSGPDAAFVSDVTADGVVDAGASDAETDDTDVEHQRCEHDDECEGAQAPSACQKAACVDGGCVLAISEGAQCDDGNACTDEDLCLGDGSCTGTPALCEDDDDCTDDDCDPAVGCVFEEVCCGKLGVPCPTGFACTEFETCENGDEVLVPAGPFWKGCNPSIEDDIGCGQLSEPQHEVVVPSFFIDKYEVTAVRGAEFLHHYDIDGCGQYPCVWLQSSELMTITTDGEGSFFPKEGWELHPANGFSWLAAKALCEWHDRRLCTGSEWENASRGGCELHDGSCEAAMPLYPWGNEPPTCEHVVSHAHCGVEELAPVGSRPAGASPYGAMDMVGSLKEYVQDCFPPSFVAAYDEAYPADGSAYEPATGCPGPKPERVVRGGSVHSLGKPDRFKPETRNKTVEIGGAWFEGWRCCRDAPSPPLPE